MRLRQFLQIQIIFKKYLCFSVQSLYIIKYNIVTIIIIYTNLHQPHSNMNSTLTQQQQLENLYNSIPQSVIANFTTHLTQYQIGDNTQIDISTQLDEDTLNKIIKEILQSTVDQQSLDKVNFDFLVNDKLLRGKLKSHLARYEISCEQVINIEYFIAFREFEHMKESPAEDWISSLCEVIGLDSNIGVMAGLFNGSIEFHEKYTKKQAKIKIKIHDAPIKAVKTIPSEQQNTYYVITGGIDQELKISKFIPQSFPQIISINNHEGAIYAIDYNPNLDGYVCTGGSKGSLNIWKIPQNFLDDEATEVKTEKKKKRKTNKKNLPQLAQQNIHKDAINSICWFNTSLVATGSSDHSIKITDVEKMRQNRSYLTKDSITTGIDFSNNMLFSSHEDGYIRTWDFRNQSTNPLQTYKSHSRYASCVKSHTHSNIFATGSYDQTIKIWDTRSVFPLQTIATNYDKVFSVCWKSQKQLISGGSSPFLTFHSI